MLSIIVPVVLFTSIVVALSLVVLAARYWLVPSELVTIEVNGRRTVEVAVGQKLLFALAGQGIFLPAACGGRGTCGQCRVIVERGTAPPLPTEAAHVSRQDAALGTRLACMLSVRDDLAIEVGEDLLEAKRWSCTVRSERFLTPFLKEIVLALPVGERIEFEAGEYVLVEAPPYRIAFADMPVAREYAADWERYGLRELVSESTEPVIRAYSLANPPQQDEAVTLVVRIATPPASAPPGTPPGRASAYLFALAAGGRVQISGPFGSFHAGEHDREMIMIAGGAGIAPIRSMILDQLARGTGRRIGFWYGARDVRDLCYREEFDALAADHENFEWHVALSDVRPGTSWDGPTGLIHAVVYDCYLRNHPAPEDAEYYLCGPPLMSAAVVSMLEDLGVEPQSIHYDDFGS